MSKTYFFTNPINCAGCRTMDTVIEETGAEVIVADVNTDEGCQLAMTYRIRGGLPAFVRVDQDENISAVWNGTMTPEGLMRFIGGQ